MKFRVYFCGMSEENFSDRILIYKPNNTLELSIETFDGCISKLLSIIKNDSRLTDSLGDYELEMLTEERVYVYHGEYLICVSGDREVSQLTADFGDDIELCYFVVGGASIESYDNYKFYVRSSEAIHRYTPHVHVEKAGEIVRYRLDTLEPMDKVCRTHKRDKKEIQAYLEAHREELLAMWPYEIKGYSTPKFLIDGRQLYPES